MVGQDDNEEDNNDGDDNTIVHSDENQNTIQMITIPTRLLCEVFVYLNKKQRPHLD